MERRVCKNAGLGLSVLGAGCWAFGGGEYWGNQDQKEVNNVVHASIDLGINYFDTAEVYNEGRSESSLGEALKGIPRDRYLIGTKISPSNCYKETLIEHCEASLKRLKSDHIDIYMIHWPIHSHSIRHFTNDTRIIEYPPATDEAVSTLQHLIEQGKIRTFGVSNFSSVRLKNIPLNEVAVNQLPYNLLCRAIEYDAIKICEENGIGIIGYMALFQGILADIYPSFEDIPVWQKRTRHFSSKTTKESRHGEEGAEEETSIALEQIRRICTETGIPMAEIALKWILKNPAITCTLAGSRSIAELEENVKASSGTLSNDIMDELDKITLPLMEKLGNHLDYYESAANDRTI
jgi:aryl-alcohol dehydrogenase-like predicted oxidoreductase